MDFKQNHFLHFIITMIVMIFIALGIGGYQVKLMIETRDANRLAASKLILVAIENYEKNFQEFPENLQQLKPFLSPIPVDPVTGELFEYQKGPDGFLIIIPQEKGEDIILKR